MVGGAGAREPRAREVHQKIFDRMRGDDDMSDRKLPEPPAPPPLGALQLALLPDDTVSMQFIVDSKIVAGASFTEEQATKVWNDLGRLLKKIRPQP